MPATPPKRARTLLFALVAALLSLSMTAAWTPNAQYYGAGLRVPMSSLRTLTFYADKRTAYRRTKPLPQLTCQGKMCSRYQPDVVQCQAMGNDQWKCSADLPSSIRMGRVEVSCEGYDYADDPYVLKDSCALTYMLLPSGRGRDDDPWLKDGGGLGAKMTEALFQALFWAVLGVIIYSFVKAIRGAGMAARNTSGGGGGGWGGGGGGGGWWPGGSYPSNGPPPPYSPKADPDSTSSSGWRPGFWTGLGLGGLAASAAASRRRQGVRGYAYDPGYGYGYGGGGFGAGPSRFGQGPRFDDDDRGIGSSSGFRESTGFGGTRNR